MRNAAPADDELGAAIARRPGRPCRDQGPCVDAPAGRGATKESAARATGGPLFKSGAEPRSSRTARSQPPCSWPRTRPGGTLLLPAPAAVAEERAQHARAARRGPSPALSLRLKRPQKAPPAAAVPALHQRRAYPGRMRAVHALAWLQVNGMLRGAARRRSSGATAVDPRRPVNHHRDCTAICSALPVLQVCNPGACQTIYRLYNPPQFSW